jgi:mannitol-specific phosphotransferase system IIBC component
MSHHVLAIVIAPPVLARGGAATADLVPVIVAQSVPLVLVTVILGGQAGFVLVKLSKQFHGTVYVLCQVAYPLV